MSLRETIELWKDGVDKAKQSRYVEAIDVFMSIPDFHVGARIYFNICNMYIELGDVAKAEESLYTCLCKDPNLAVGYFQSGCLKIVNRKYKEAMTDFDNALKNLRGNLLIDYKPLGLMYKLYSCEVMYNRAYCLHHLGMKDRVLKELCNALQAATQLSLPHPHYNIFASSASQYQTKDTDFQPFAFPTCKSAMLFMPPRAKAKVLDSMDFLGQSVVVSSVIPNDSFTGFVGAQKRREKELYKNPNDVATVNYNNVSQLPTQSKLKDGRAKNQLVEKSSLHSLMHCTTHHHTPYRSRYLGLKSASTNKPSQSSSVHTITVRVHYQCVKTIYVTSNITYEKLLHLVCGKFGKKEGVLSLWYKDNTEAMKELKNDDGVSKAISENLEEGFRLKIWAYDYVRTMCTFGSATLQSEEVIIRDRAAYFYKPPFKI